MHLSSQIGQILDYSWELRELSAFTSYLITFDRDYESLANVTASLTFLKALYSADCRALSTSELHTTFSVNASKSQASSELISSEQVPVATMLVTLGVTAILTGSSGLFWLFIHNIQIISYIRSPIFLCRSLCELF